MENKHVEVYELFIKEQKALHEKNQARVKVGLKVNILLPLVFLVISFITKSSKLVFLILWIVSLFGIAGYLVYVEYTDHKIQELLAEYGVSESEEMESLLGNTAATAEAIVVGAVNSFDDKIAEGQRRIEGEIKDRVGSIMNMRARNDEIIDLDDDSVEEDKEAEE